MLSRVAETILWLSRYVERAENYARFVDVNLHLTLDMPNAGEEQWYPLVVTTGDQDDFNERYGKPTRENVIHFLTFDRENPNSILSCLHAARENARSIRETITSAMWEQINRYYLMVKEQARQAKVLELPHEFFTDVKLNSHLFVGITDSTLSHGEGWHFSRLGRLLERADKTLRILDVKYFVLLPSLQDVGSALDDIQWSALLRSASALEMYRQAHGRIHPRKVVDFLILNRDFPRSVQFCLIKADESLHAITGSPIGLFENVAEHRLGQLRSRILYLEVADIFNHGLHEFIDDTQTRINKVGEAVYEAFFADKPIGHLVGHLAR